MTRKGPAGVERRAVPRASYTADRDRAILIALGLHAAIILFLIFFLPYLPRHDVAEMGKPIAITMVASPAPEPEQILAPSPAASQQPAPEATPTQATAQDQTAAAAPATDPSFNPFALGPRAELRSSEPDAPPAVQTPAEAPQGIALPPYIFPAQPGETGTSATGNGTMGGGVAENTLLGNGGGPGAAASMRPQYLRIRLNRDLPANYANQLHMFLQRLIDCGVVPILAHNPAMTVEADVSFNPQGNVQSAQLTNDAAFASDPDYKIAAGELMGALSKRGCSFIMLPPLFYQSWGVVHLSFFQKSSGP